MSGTIREHYPRLRLARRQASALQSRRIDSRAGFSLLEIILSTALLLAALTAIGVQTGIAVQTSLRAQFEAEGSLLCESLLNQRRAENNWKATTKPQPVDSTGQWLYEVRSEPYEGSALKQLRIDVWRSGRYAMISRTTLVRLVRDDAIQQQGGL